MLEQLTDALKMFAVQNGLEKVFYGMASDRSNKMKKWNYIILKRARNARSGKSSNDSTEYCTKSLTRRLAHDTIKFQFFLK